MTKNKPTAKEYLWKIIDSYRGTDFKEFRSIVYTEFKKLFQIRKKEPYALKWYLIGAILASCYEKRIELPNKAVKIAAEIFETDFKE